METEVYRGNIIRITEEKIGNITWERAYLPSGVVIFPITHEGKIIMVNEKRPHETPPFRVKAVSGIIEPEKGSPEENAQREMQEEIGFKAKRLELLWHMKGSGTINHDQYFFIAHDLISSKLPNPDGEDTIINILEFTPIELLQKLRSDELRWSISTLGIFRLIHKMGLDLNS